LVNVTKKPTSAVEGVVKILTMPEKDIVQHVDLEDLRGFEPTAGRIKRLMDTG
jgi:hypothetical protein